MSHHTALAGRPAGHLPSAICNLLLLALALAPAAAADYFVAPAGSDETGTGAVERPFQSIRKGLSLAQPGDRVVLRAGEYRLWGREGPVHFPRAGEPGKPITLTAYRDEYAALLGSVRLKQPRDEGKRENPPVSALTSPGEWTAADGFLYLWCREGDDPANHRIEASQSIVLFLDKPWVRAEKLHVFFGQPIGMELAADHVVAAGVEVAHVANSVDNAYAAYFSSCSNSVLRNSMIHDSYYWGDHSSNSHVVSCIDCGDNGPNRVENCDIFNGGLGVGTKGAAREMFILNNRITDVYHGVVTSGERVSGPIAGKKDRGHYLVFGNRFRDCVDGVYFYSGQSHGNRIYGNLFQRCGTAIALRNIEGCPEQPEFADNIFLDNGTAVHLDGGHKGDETPPLFYEAGLRSHHNLFFGNKVDWSSPLAWSRSSTARKWCGG